MALFEDYDYSGGWANYATRRVAEEYEERGTKKAKELYEFADGLHRNTYDLRNEVATELSDFLWDLVRSEIPPTPSYLWNDIMRSVFDTVDFEEIANAFLDSVILDDTYEDEDDEF